MNKKEKEIVARLATLDDFKKMLSVARKEIKNWDKPYKKNPNLTIAALFNIFAGACKEYENEKIAQGSGWRWNFDNLSVRNAVDAFGEYMPLTPQMRDEILKLREDKKKVSIKPTYFPKPIDFFD